MLLQDNLVTGKSGNERRRQWFLSHVEEFPGRQNSKQSQVYFKSEKPCHRRQEGDSKRRPKKLTEVESETQFREQSKGGIEAHQKALMVILSTLLTK